jgi:hypothetical protein
MHGSSFHSSLAATIIRKFKEEAILWSLASAKFYNVILGE